MYFLFSIFEKRIVSLSKIVGLFSLLGLFMASTEAIAGSITVSESTSTDGTYRVSWNSINSKMGYAELVENNQVLERISATGYKDFTKTANGTYSYKVYEVDCTMGGCGNSVTTAVGPTTVIVDLPLPAPSKPSSLTPSSTSTTATSINLSWPKAIGTVHSYTLQKRLGTSGTWSTLAAINATANTSTYTATASGLSVGEWYFQVQACADTCSGWRAASSVSILTPNPGKPSSITVPASSTHTSHTINWGSALGTVSRYELEQYHGSWSNVYSGPNRNKTVSNLSGGTYKYRVRACNNSGCSGYRESSTVTVNSLITVSESTSTDGTYRVSWSGINSRMGYAELVENNQVLERISATGYKDFTKTADGTYSYKIYEVDCTMGGCGNSVTTAVGPKTVTVNLPTPSTPTNFNVSASSTSTTASFSWNSSTGNPDTYKLSRSLDQINWTTTYSGAATSTSQAGFMLGHWFFRLQACRGNDCSGYVTASANVGWTQPVLSASAETTTGLIVFHWDHVNLDQTISRIYDLTNGSTASDGSSNDINVSSSTTSGTASLTKNLNGTYRYVLKQFTQIVNPDTNVPRYIEIARSNEISVQVNIQLPGVESANLLQPVTASGQTPYTAVATNMGDAEIRIPISVVPGVNGHQPNLSLAYNSNRLRKLVDEEWEEDNIGSGWRVSGLSVIRSCSKQTLAQVDPYLRGDVTYKPMCIDGQLFVQNNPAPIDETPGSESYGWAQPFWQYNANEYVLWQDAGIKIRSFDMLAPGKAGHYTVYYPDGSVSEYGNSEDSRQHISYISYTDDRGVTIRGSIQGHSHLPSEHSEEEHVDSYVWRINKHTDAFGNEIHYEYYKDEIRELAMPKRISYGPQGAHDSSVEFSYQERLFLAGGQGAHGNMMVPPLNADGTALNAEDYIDWLINGYATSAPTAINKITLKHNNQPVREYNMVHEPIPETAGLVRLNHVQLCAYKNAERDCLHPLTVNWDGPPDSEHLTRINQIQDNQGNWTQFQYKKVDPTDSTLFFTDSPFGPAPTEFSTLTERPNQRGLIEDFEPSVLVEMRRNDGKGGHRTLKYRYLGEGIESKRGWGFMGYHGTRVEDLEQSIFTYSQYSVDHRFIGRKVAELSMLGAYGNSSSQMLSKNITVWDARYLRHGQYRWLNSVSLLMASPAHSHHIFPRYSIRYQYEEGQQFGVQIIEQTPEFMPWQSAYGKDSGYQYPFIGNTQTTRWAANATLTPGSTGANNWGIYQLKGITGIERSQKEEVDYQENRDPLALQVAFPLETRTSVYSGDTNTVPEYTTIKRSTPYLINGMARSLVGTHTQYAENPDLELTTEYRYTPFGAQNSVTVSGANVASRTTTTRDYIASRYPQTYTNALGQSAHKTFDTRTGIAVSSTDLNGQTSTSEHDAFGRPISVTTPDLVTLTTQYELCENLGTCPTVDGISANRRVWVSSPISPDTYQYLDSLGRELRTETIAFDGINRIYLDTHYNPFGQIAKKSLPYYADTLPEYLQQHYDELGRLIQTTHPDGNINHIHYGVEQGQKVVTRTTNVFDSQGYALETKINKSYFNVIDGIKKTTDAYGTTEEISTEFDHYATGLTKNINVGGVQVASFEYDTAGNRTLLQDQSAGTITSAYNALGQIRYRIDNAGNRTDYSYDPLNRPTQETTGDGVQHWGYDPIDALGGLDYSEFIDSRNGYTHRQTLSYFADSKPSGTTTEIDVPGFATRTYPQSFTYDHYGRSDSITYASGITVSSAYNSAGYLERVEDNKGNSLQSIARVDVLGNVTQMSYGNGVTSARAYNPLNGQLESVSTTIGTTQIQDNNFQWRSDGLLESRRNNTGQSKTENFTYDNLSRLTGSNTLAGGHIRTTATTYALNGNILSKTASNSLGNKETNVTGYQYGTTTNAGPNAVSDVNIDGVANTLYYNKNGSITHYDAATGPDKFVDWTARGKPWRITQGTSANDTTPDARDEIAYGINGARYYKHSTWQDSNGKEQTDITFYVGEYEDVLPGNDPKYTRIERTRINDNVLHIRITTHLSTVQENIEFFHKDHLGSIEAITDQYGTILQKMSFDAFGARRKTNWAGELTQAETETLLAEIGIGTSRGYTGHEHLDRTGLIHMNGRVYDPTLGRFLSADPLVQAPYFSQSYNRYTYTFNNPLILTDPSGYGSAGAGNYAHTVGIGFTIVFAGAGGFNLGSNTTYNVKVTNANTGTSVIRKLTGSDISNIQSMEGMSVSLAGPNARGSFEGGGSNRSTNTTVDVSSQTDKESPTEATQATLEGITKDDFARLSSYAENENIESLVDSAVNKSSFLQKFKGQAGRNVDQLQRYLFVKDVGWVDLQHVISGATSPGASIGLSIDLGHAFEAFQLKADSKSAFKTEDLVSNYIGSMAAHHNAFYGSSSLGTSVSHILGQFNVLTQNEAIKYIDTNGSKGLDL